MKTEQLIERIDNCETDECKFDELCGFANYLFDNDLELSDADRDAVIDIINDIDGWAWDDDETSAAKYLMENYPELAYDKAKEIVSHCVNHNYTNCMSLIGFDYIWNYSEAVKIIERDNK